MKIRLFAIALVTVIVGFNACSSKKENKSSECDIIAFKLLGVDYTKDGNTFSKVFTKTGVLNWGTGCPTVATKPDLIQLSPKATFVGTPNQDTPVGFANDNAESFSVTYTIQAEDGTKKTWTVRGQRSMSF